MAAYPEKCCATDKPTKELVFRVIDDAIHVLTTRDPLKALRTLQKVLDDRGITVAWVEEEEVE